MQNHSANTDQPHTNPTERGASPLHIEIENVEDSIQPLPAAATKIIELCRDTNADLSEIVTLIECEPTIAGKLIEVSNSPLYGMTREVKTVNYAVVLLGGQAVAQMALSIATAGLFTSGDDAVAEHRQQLFRQSLGVATANRLIASEFGDVDPDEAFLVGVVHDIGKLLFFDLQPSAYFEILDRNPLGETIDDERQTFGIDHATIGQKCCHRWGMNPVMAETVRNHHLPFSELENDLGKILCGGRYYARLWQLGFLDETVATVDAAIESAYGSAMDGNTKETAIEQFEAIEEICLS